MLWQAIMVVKNKIQLKNCVNQAQTVEKEYFAARLPYCKTQRNDHFYCGLLREMKCLVEEQEMCHGL